jgi:GNAT superfamily N-acetyltransferase
VSSWWLHEAKGGLVKVVSRPANESFEKSTQAQGRFLVFWRKKIATVFRLGCHAPRTLLRLLTGHVYCWLIYEAKTEATDEHKAPRGLEFRALTEDDLRSFPLEEPDFRQRTLERLARFGRTYAYGVFVDGCVAHVSWLLPAGIVRAERPRIFRMREDENEVTAVETLPSYRGKGILTFAVARLLTVAQKQGIKRLYAKIDTANKASQAGFRKTAFRRVGFALVITPPALPHCKLVWRLYRRKSTFSGVLVTAQRSQSASSANDGNHSA